MKWHIGCSGFHYKEWKEAFYPSGLPMSKWFAYYTQYFDTVELNVTFYRFPRVNFLENWYDNSPSKFIFSVKVPRLITHFKKFNDCERMMRDFYSTCEAGLKEKLGPVLFQLPPNMPYRSEKFEQLLGLIDRSYHNVVECRHESWWSKEVIDNFRQHKLSFCGVSYPNLPWKVVATTNTLYYRFHGVPKLYISSYEDSFLEKIATGIKKSGVKSAFVYFNNTAGPAAVENAGFIRDFLKTRGY